MARAATRDNSTSETMNKTIVNDLPQVGTSAAGESNLPQGICPSDSGEGNKVRNRATETGYQVFAKSPKVMRSPVAEA